MRIGTWNVEYGVGRRNVGRLAQLAEHDADIWVLTETHSDLSLAPGYTRICSEARPNREAGSVWVAVWSRFAVARSLPVPDPLRMAAAVLDTPSGPAAVAGVVLPWHSDRGDTRTTPEPRNWEEHRRVVRTQVPELLRTLRAAATRCVLAGDFNTSLAADGPSPRPYRYGLKDERAAILRELDANRLVCHTAETQYPPPASPRFLIDHVCTDFGPPTSLTTWAGDGNSCPPLSDHPGVVVIWGG